jgi:outer membrane biosynthesis protein TonB
MDQSQPNRPYSADEIRSYLSGNMSAADMHALEKAALSDPMLADAIEGYQQADGQLAQKQLDELKRQITRKSGDSRATVWKTRKYMQWAAMLALIAMTLATGYLLLKGPGNQPGEKSIAENRLPENTIVADNSTQSKDSTLNKELTQPITESTAANKTADNTQKTITAAVETSTTESKKAEQQLPQVAEGERNKLAANEPTVVSATESSAAELPVNQATAPESDVSQLEKKEMQEAESTVKLKRPAQDKISTVTTTKAISGEDPVPETASPSIGWNAYKQYLSSSISLPQEVRTKYQGRTVKLGFTVGRNGKPTDIRVLESVAPQCDAEAIRLLKSGSGWVPGSKEKGRAVISVNF